jgi:hypothetical protein
MPKGRTPSLISASNGRPKRVDVQRKSTCCRCDCGIEAGAHCFNIPKAGQGFSKEKRYCLVCYKNVIEQTEKDLVELKEEIKTL